MKVVWDEPKRLTNLTNRGMDFGDLEDGEFFVTAIVIPAKEGRFKAIGMFEGDLLTVIFKPLGREAVSVISMRHASRQERKIHGKS